jgi:hypothetical protein
MKRIINATQGLLAGTVLVLGACGATAQPQDARPAPAERREPSRAPLGQAGGPVVPPPSGIDPGIHAPMPPAAGHPMPVIPPPGAADGDRRLQPR